MVLKHLRLLKWRWMAPTIKIELTGRPGWNHEWLIYDSPTLSQLPSGESFWVWLRQFDCITWSLSLIEHDWFKVQIKANKNRIGLWIDLAPWKTKLLLTYSNNRPFRVSMGQYKRRQPNPEECTASNQLISTSSLLPNYCGRTSARTPHCGKSTRVREASISG